ncbi:NADPH:quinone oxidoreductase family protein [Iodidimonas sp. SYSU 1G8]|uniref:NADPH:quinone oxidoreductase family protein n=1 Tax=Iodidimonas sp. SYSU 1G8 TaxID=3133967 RepID=UPI0031FE48C9
MRAWVCRQFSDYHDIAIDTVPDPEPGAGQVLVRPRAACVTFVEMLQVQGKHQHKPKTPFIPGGECAGEVLAVGEGVTRFRPGDKIMGGVRFGAYAELAVTDEGLINPLPPAFDWYTGASFGSAYRTAYVGIVTRGGIQPGETLLVHASSGGVGLAAVELGKILGCTVIGTGGDNDRLEIVKRMGADHVINYRETPRFRDAVKELTGGKGADVIYDPVGGDVFDESTHCIAPFGRILIIGFTSGRIPSIPVNYPLIKQFAVIGVRAGEYGRLNPEGGRRVTADMMRMANEGLFHPHVHKIMPFEGLVNAFDEIAARKVAGRIVLEISRD